MKKIIVSGATYYYNTKVDSLFYDRNGCKQVPLSCFDLHQYQSFLKELQRIYTKKSKA